MTPEQAALLRKAQDSVRAAKLLASQGFYDFAASRAYYAMFYVAEAILLSQGLSFSKHSGSSSDRVCSQGTTGVVHGYTPYSFMPATTISRGCSTVNANETSRFS